MQESFYYALHWFVRKHAGLKRCVEVSTKLLPGIVYVVYPAALLYTLLFHRGQFLYMLLVPAAGFVICTVLRAGLNRPRPYEAMGIPAIVPKATKGKSFPSRHAACAAVIAVTLLPVYPGLGGALLVISLLLVVGRVLAGVHFIRDVLCGWLLGAAVGLLGMVLLL